MKGRVKFFNDAKGFGFIAGEDGKEYFVHHSALSAGVALKEGAAVAFDVEQGDRGPKAARVKLDTADAAAAEEPADEEASEEEDDVKDE